MQKSLSFNEKYWRIFWKKFRRKGQQAENDKTERVTGLGRRTREEIAKWNQMTALRFQTGGRHQTSPASLRGPWWEAELFGAPKRNTSHGNEVLPQDTTHFIQRPCFQRGNPCQDPAGNRTTRKLPDHCKETQSAVVWTCLPFIRSDQNHLARHSEEGKKTRLTKEEVGRQHQGMDRPGVHQV